MAAGPAGVSPARFSTALTGHDFVRAWRLAP